MNIAPTPNSRPPAAAPGQPVAASCPPKPGTGQAAAPRPAGEPELAVVAVLGYN